MARLHRTPEIAEDIFGRLAESRPAADRTSCPRTTSSRKLGGSRDRRFHAPRARRPPREDRADALRLRPDPIRLVVQLTHAFLDQDPLRFELLPVERRRDRDRFPEADDHSREGLRYHETVPALEDPSSLRGCDRRND